MKEQKKIVKEGLKIEGKSRIVLYDNVKAFLIICVVVGHFVDNIVNTHSTNALFIFIYTFHMPLFIFISGLMHSRYNSGDKFNRDRFISLVLIYFAIKIIYSSVKLVLNGKTTFSLLDGDGYHWFVLALALFEVIIYFVREYCPYIILIVSILLSVFIGFDSSLGDYLALYRVVVFLPFFLIGYYIEPKKILEITRKWYAKFFSIIIIIGYALVCWFKTDFIYAYRLLFTGRNSFERVSSRLPDVDIWSRSIVELLSLIVGFAIICIIPNVRLKCFSNMGKKTMQIYFWHRPIVYVLTFYECHKRLGEIINPIIATIIYLFAAIVLSFILALPIFKHPTNDLFKLRVKAKEK